MKALLKEGFCGDKLCLVLLSMMWQVGITVVKGETFHQIKFHTPTNSKMQIWCLSIARDDTMFQLVSSFSVICTCNHNLVPRCTQTDVCGTWMGPHGAQTDIMCTSCLMFVKHAILS